MKKLMIAIVMASSAALADSGGDWPSVAGSGAHSIQNEGVEVTQQSILNFTGDGIDCQNSGGKTVCDSPGPSGATVFDQVAGETDMRYDSTTEHYYMDEDGDGTKDAGEEIIGADQIVYVKDYLGTTASTLLDVQAAVDAATDGQIVMMPEGLTTINLSSDSGGTPVSITASAAANTFTRASGSWTGVEVGDWITFCSVDCSSASVPSDYEPFTINTQNNQLYEVTNIAGTVLTVSDPGEVLANETATADYVAGKRGIELTDRKRLFGYGGGSIDLVSPTNPGSRLTFSDSMGGVGIHINGSGVQIRNINITLSTAPRHRWTPAIMCGWDGFYSENVIDSVGIQGGTAGTGIGLYIRGCLTSTLSNSHIHRMGKVETSGSASIVIDGSPASEESNASNAWKFIGNHLQSGDGILVESGSYPTTGLPTAGFTMIGNVIEGGVYGLYWKSEQAYIGQVSLFGNWFESTGQDCSNVRIDSAYAVMSSYSNRYSVGGVVCDSNFKRTIASAFAANREYDNFNGDVFTGAPTVADFELSSGVVVVANNVLGSGGYTVSGGGSVISSTLTESDETVTGDWTFSGATSVPTVSANDNDTSSASTAYVQTELSAYASDTVAFTNKTLTGGLAHDLGAATSLEIPNGADPTTDTAAEIAFDTDRYAASRGTIEFYDGTASVFAVGTTDAPGDGQVPKYVSASGTIEWSNDNDTGGVAGTLDALSNVDTTAKNDGDILVWNAGAGDWVDAAPSSAAQAWTVADPVLLSTTTSDVVVGTGQVNSGKFTIDGDADQVQLTVQGNGTQTDSVVIVENSAGTEVANINADGTILGQSLYDIDGPGTSWSIDSTGNATFASATIAPSASPTVTFNDSDSASEATDATISAAATDTGAGTEDVDLDFQVQVNSTITSRFYIDADGNVQVKNGALQVDATDPADAGAIRLDNAENIAWEASPTGTDVTMGADSSEIIQIGGGFLAGDDLEQDAVDTSELAATLTFSDGDLLDFGTNISSSTEGILLPKHATTCASATAEGQVCWDVDSDILSIGNGATTTTFSAGGDSVTVNTSATVDPDFDNGGDIAFAYSAPDITATIQDDKVVAADLADGDWGDVSVATNVVTLDADAVASSEIATIVQSMHWSAGSVSSDGTNCADPAQATINSGPKQYTIICNTASNGIVYGWTTMPDGWDGGTVTMEVSYLQTAADTNAMNSDIDMQCHASGETVNSTYGTPIAIDDAGVSGSNIIDHTTSAAVTPAGTCAAGDTLFWRWTMDATGTTTVQSTLHVLGWKLEYVSNVGD